MEIMRLKKGFSLLLVLLLAGKVSCQDGNGLNNSKIDGYRGIWFELNQKYEYGDKYSGGLGTYTAKHVPLAIYAVEVDKTFFVYGGTTDKDAKYLLCMAGVFDHKTETVSKPTVVYDKQGVDDPHDNPSIMIDDEGYIRIFVSGRGRSRPGFKFKSLEPWSIDAFEMISEEEMTYPQPWNTEYGYIHLFTKYTGVRQLYFETSTDGVQWSDDSMLAAIPANEGEKSGHYQVSNCFEGKTVGTFFNRHPDGNVDIRTDLYYVQTTDFAHTWTNIKGQTLTLPLIERESAARVIDYQSQHKNVYLKDMGFDANGNPACLHIRSNGHKPGPGSAPYEWCVSHWDGKNWQTSVITTSDHNYDMGSLFITDQYWRVVGPTEIGPQEWGTGGELAIWQSKNEGKTWKKIKDITDNSVLNHCYVRRPVHYKSPFCFFWATGDPDKLSISELYFGDFDGHIWKLPYHMTKDDQTPVKVR